MKKNMRSFGKDSLMYMPSKLIEGIMGILIIVFYTRLFPPDEYGVFSLIVGIVGILTTITFGWLNHSLLRYYDENKSNNKFYTSVFIIWVTINIIVLILFLISNLFINFSGIDNLKFYLFPFFILGNSWILLSTLLRASRMAGLYSLLLSLSQILKFVIVIVLVKLFDIGVTSIFISTIICELIVVTTSFIKMGLVDKIDLNSRGISKPLIKSFFSYGFPLIGVALVTWILSISDRYIIAFYKGTGDAGIYTIGYSLVSQPLNLIISSIMLSAFPLIIKTWNESGIKETESFISKITNYYLIVMIPAVVGIFLLREEIFLVLAHEDYFIGNEVMPWTALGFLFLGMTQYVNKILELKQRTTSLLYIIAIVAVINLILNIIFIPFFGIKAAAITTMLSYAIYFIISLVRTRKLIVFKVSKKSMTKIALSSLFMGIVVYLFKTYISNVFSLGLSITMGAAVYLCSLYFLGEVKAEVAGILTVIRKKR
ncbi:lipopolysaccharide biosynthesis protein [Lederbergia lenta]|uniref:lipopolysaccharide biosynthesis protein n=1 Tax=Lederbergia lenta TaxID=1467 RepID=UPI002040BC86|nr:polysaccharide biosynthesis C-terminal domain-containing protein [Lederbergia lenta]MCM3111984.1 polysaccharide biosynthesis C-terminal domain-containing protein [Lederbergia lenta]